MATAVETLRDTPFAIGGRTFHSRLMVGTGKYSDNETMVRAIEASGAEIVTVAVRRVDLDRTKQAGVLYHLDPKRYFLLANTAGCARRELAEGINAGVDLNSDNAAYWRRLTKNGQGRFFPPINLALTEHELIKGKPHAIRNHWEFLGLRGDTRRPCRRTNPTRCARNCANGSGLNQVADGRGYAGPLQGSECHHPLRGKQQRLFDQRDPLPALGVDRGFDRWRGQDLNRR